MSGYNPEGHVWGIAPLLSHYLLQRATRYQLVTPGFNHGMVMSLDVPGLPGGPVLDEDLVQYQLYERRGSLAIWNITGWQAQTWQPSQNVFQCFEWDMVAEPNAGVGTDYSVNGFGCDPVCSVEAYNWPAIGDPLYFMTVTLRTTPSTDRTWGWEYAVVLAQVAGDDLPTIWAALLGMHEPDEEHWGLDDAGVQFDTGGYPSLITSDFDGHPRPRTA